MKKYHTVSYDTQEEGSSARNEERASLISLRLESVGSGDREHRSGEIQKRKPNDTASDKAFVLLEEEASK